MDFFMGLLSERVASDNVLRKVGALIDWRRVGWKVGKVRSQLGRSGYDVDLMLRVLLLGHWHSLSDRKLGEALRVRLDFMLFCGASLFEHVPDHRTICGFRCALVRLGLFGAVLIEVNRQLSAHGLKVEHAAVAVVDATVIEGAGRPRRLIEGMAMDRAEEAVEGAAGGVVTECLSADPDGRWSQSGRNLYFGHKGFWRRDGEGYVERVLVRPGNEGEAPHLPRLLKGCTAVRVLADKAYSSETNGAVLAQQGFKSGIMYRARRNHPPSARQKRFNRLVARQRWVIEQSFGTLKGLFHGEVSTKLSDTANVRAESARVSTRHPRAGPENGETPESRRIRINSQQSLSILISITSKMTSRIAKIR